MKPVTVSVVSHGQADLVEDLLTDLSRHCAATIEKVVLTCNKPEILPSVLDRLQFPVELIRNDRPLGFGANHNQAFLRCATTWFLVINPDVRISTDVLSELLKRADTDTGLLAPQEFDASGTRVENLRGLITPWELVQRQVLKRPPPPPANGWVKGMFMLIRSAAFQEAGGFDPRYFMYCEDFDLCARLVLQGWKINHHADVAVTHAWQRSSHRSSSHLRHHLQSLARMWTSRAYWAYRQLASRG